MVPAGGLLDPFTATLVLLGLGLAMLGWRQPVNQMLLVALLTSIPPAAIVTSQLTDVYRMNGIVPALFLALALALDRLVALAQTARIPLRWTMVALLLLALVGDSVNINRLQSILANDAFLCGKTDLLSAVRAEGIALAETTNRLRPAQDVYLISGHLEEWAWAWLFHGPLPSQIQPSTLPDPSIWPVLIQLPPTSAGASFWPPHLAPDKIGITYFMADDEAAGLFLPVVQRAYPGGFFWGITPDRCTSQFQLRAYSLTAQQVQHPPIGGSSPLTGSTGP